MKWATTFICAVLSMSSANAIRQDDDEVGIGKLTSVFTNDESFQALEKGKWCGEGSESLDFDEEGYDSEKCQKACTDDSNCKFVCFDANANFCSTYKECGTLTDRPHDFDQETSGWTCWKKVANEEQDAEILDNHEQEEHDSQETESQKIESTQDGVKQAKTVHVGGDAKPMAQPEHAELADCECAEDKYQKGSAPGDTMCAFKGVSGWNCARTKGRCPGQAVKCRKPKFEEEESVETSKLNALPECTCAEDKYQSGSKSGDTMCAFQGGKNCALSKGSCPEGKAIQCRKP